MSNFLENFHYENTEVIKKGGKKTIRKVFIKNGKGYKYVKHYNGKHKTTHKRKLHKDHVSLIKIGKFIPGLFNDCKSCKKKYINDVESKIKTRKNRQKKWFFF